jgi:hypothetical protein
MVEVGREGSKRDCCYYLYLLDGIPQDDSTLLLPNPKNVL